MWFILSSIRLLGRMLHLNISTHSSACVLLSPLPLPSFACHTFVSLILACVLSPLRIYPIALSELASDIPHVSMGLVILYYGGQMSIPSRISQGRFLVSFLIHDYYALNSLSVPWGLGQTIARVSVREWVTLARHLIDMYPYSMCSSTRGTRWV